MNNSFESFELSTELIFQRFLMDKERRKNFYNGLELADYIALKVMEKDCIDDTLTALGFEVKDTKDGFEWRLNK